MDSFIANLKTRDYADGKMLAATEDGVGIVIFNQPEKRNAMSVEMWEGLGTILDGFSADPKIRSIVLTGAGEKAFVSGADISQFEKRRANADDQRNYNEMIAVNRVKYEDFSKPMIARIQGFCLGGGLAIAMQADIRIASMDSQFGIPAARLGIAYGPESVKQLVNLVGPAHARMILYTAKRMNAAEAERIGLINKAVPVEELSAAVLDIARAISENAPLSIAASKLTIGEVLKDAQDRNMEAVRQIGVTCFNSADYEEGRRAFMEKRRPVFLGR